MESLKAMGRSPLEMPLKALTPMFSFFAVKWSELRQDKVEMIKERFSKNLNAAFILKDNKFNGDDLALIRKVHLENLIKINDDFRTGEAAILESVEGIFKAVDILIEAIEVSHVDKKNTLLAKAIEGVKFHFKGQFKQSVLYANHPEEKKSRGLSESDRKLFKELEDLEEK